MKLLEQMRRRAALDFLTKNIESAHEWIKNGGESQDADPKAAELLAEFVESLLIAGGTPIREALASRLFLGNRPETSLCEHGKYLLGTEPAGTNRSFVCPYCFPPSLGEGSLPF